jgi:hypothetical protein
MKRTILTLAVLGAVAPALAGTVYTVETKFLNRNPAETSTGTMSVEGGNLRMEIADAGNGHNGEIIFRHWGDPHENLDGKHGKGSGREMVMVNHDDKSYFVMDEATMQQMAAQMSQAMAAMDQALAAVPESQRKKMEEMMKSRMPMPAAPREPSKLKKTGDTETINGYPCVRYEVWRAGSKERELWVTDWSNVDGSAEIADVFRDMAAFMTELLDSLPDIGGMKGLADDSFAHLEEMNGFPVVTRELADDGSVEFETTLTSSQKADLSAADFEPPPSYKRQDLMKGMKRN